MIGSITREEIQQRLDRHEALTIVEALPARYYDAEHLPGAINLPHTEVRDRAESVLTDKSAFIVVYCSNTACQNSTIASQLLIQLGYSNVHEYVEGKQDWIEAGLPVESGTEVAA